MTYQDEYYPGIIESFTDEGAVVSAMLKMPKGNWKWPKKTDSIPYTWEEIIGSINPQKKSIEEACSASRAFTWY